MRRKKARQKFSKISGVFVSGIGVYFLAFIIFLKFCTVNKHNKFTVHYFSNIETITLGLGQVPFLPYNKLFSNLF